MNMRRLKYLFIAQLLMIPMIFSQFSTVSSPIMISGSEISTSAYGVSKYSITNYVTYDTVINLTLSRTNGSHEFKVSRIGNREPNAPLNNTAHTPEYQECELVYHKITGASGIYGEGFKDEFNNTYDQFNKTDYGTVKLDQRYTITQNAIEFSTISDADVGAYTPGDYAHILYNRSETNYDCGDSNLIALSNSIVGASTNPVDKAQKIYNWIAANIAYVIQADPMGATWTYNNKKGDCSDYSGLMITLLRIQGIPARKVTGYCISNAPTSTYPQVGDVFSFTWNLNTGSSTLLGHAWLEYYVPNVGWIACDPTWHQGNYFNKMDYLHIGLSVGSWFSLPGAAPDQDEYGSPVLVSGQYDLYNTTSYTITFTVTATDVIPPTDPPVDWLMWVIVIAILVGGVIILTVIIKKTRD